MSDLDIAVENILDEEDDAASEKEQDTIDGAQFSAKNPKYKIPKLSLGDTMAVLRATIKLHAAQNI